MKCISKKQEKSSTGEFVLLEFEIKPEHEILVRGFAEHYKDFIVGGTYGHDKLYKAMEKSGEKMDKLRCNYITFKKQP